MPNRIEATKLFSPQIGLEKKSRQLIAGELGKLLADSYLLGLKTQNYHWNVTGQLFPSLHLLFEEQYRELSQAIDQIAERIRALGEPAPGSFAAFSRLGHIKEESGAPTASEMVKNLVQGHEILVSTAREALKTADDNEDDVTADMLINRMQVHEKWAWMLRSMVSPQV